MQEKHDIFSLFRIVLNFNKNEKKCKFSLVVYIIYVSLQYETTKQILTI
jgi:hypothetical protein